MYLTFQVRVKATRMVHGAHKILITKKVEAYRNRIQPDGSGSNMSFIVDVWYAHRLRHIIVIFI